MLVLEPDVGRYEVDQSGARHRSPQLVYDGPQPAVGRFQLELAVRAFVGWHEERGIILVVAPSVRAETRRLMA
jgi:hypothetical protein